MGAILKTVLKTLGLDSWLGTGTIILGIFLAMSAAATWLREDGIRQCTSEWELKIAQEALKIEKAVAERNRKIVELEQKLKEAEDADGRKAEEERQKLDKQRDAVSLSADCIRCRVPNARIWVQSGKASRISSPPTQ